MIIEYYIDEFAKLQSTLDEFVITSSTTNTSELKRMMSMMYYKLTSFENCREFGNVSNYDYETVRQMVLGIAYDGRNILKMRYGRHNDVLAKFEQMRVKIYILVNMLHELIETEPSLPEKQQPVFTENEFSEFVDERTLDERTFDEAFV